MTGAGDDPVAWATGSATGSARRAGNGMAVVALGNRLPAPTGDAVTSSRDLHGRDIADNAFFEWLLSDHPDARAERDWRRAATYHHQRGQAASARALADAINADPGASQADRDRAAWAGPRANEFAVRAETEFAVPDDLFVAPLRTGLEAAMRCSGTPGYHYPGHLTGPGAADYPPPPEPEAEGIEPG